jgi:hypothetical protein
MGDRRSMNETPPPIEVERDLFPPLRGDYLSLCGEEAERWLRAVRSKVICGLAQDLDRALGALRGHDRVTALEVLQTVERRLVGLATPFPSIHHLLARYLCAVRAYYHYLSADLKGAKLDLQQAHDHLVRALSRNSFLMPLALHFIDFLSQRARIARREHRWREAQEYIDVVRGIYSEDQPFCRLDSGRFLRMSDLRSFFGSLPLDESQQRRAQALLEDDRAAERIAEAVLTLPDLVIPYP